MGLFWSMWTMLAPMKNVSLDEVVRKEDAGFETCFANDSEGDHLLRRLQDDLASRRHARCSLAWWVRVLSLQTSFAVLGLLSGCGGVAAKTPAPAPPSIQASADHASITAGESFVLAWTAANAATVTLQPGGQTLATNGSLTLKPTSTTTYTLTATGPGGTSSAAVTITVAAPPPTITVTASATSIMAGQSISLQWSTTNTTSVTLHPGAQTLAASGSLILAPVETTTYTLTATGAGGSKSTSITVTVAAAPPPAEVSAAPLTKDEIKELQGRLGAVGFGPGPIDGVVGPQTQAALRRYADARGLANSDATRELLSRLKGESSARK